MPNQRSLSAPSAAKSGTISASSARPGIVWITPATPSSPGARRGRRVIAMPSGTAIAVAMASAPSESSRCAAA